MFSSCLSFLNFHNYIFNFYSFSSLFSLFFPTFVFFSILIFSFFDLGFTIFVGISVFKSFYLLSFILFTPYFSSCPCSSFLLISFTLFPFLPFPVRKKRNSMKILQYETHYLFIYLSIYVYINLLTKGENKHSRLITISSWSVSTHLHTYIFFCYFH